MLRRWVGTISLHAKYADHLIFHVEMAFYIDKKGRRARPDWSIQWIGHPNAFALSVPYIVAFDPTFIEVRHIDTVSFGNGSNVTANVSWQFSLSNRVNSSKSYPVKTYDASRLTRWIPFTVQWTTLFLEQNSSLNCAGSKLLYTLYTHMTTQTLIRIQTHTHTYAHIHSLFFTLTLSTLTFIHFLLLLSFFLTHTNTFITIYILLFCSSTNVDRMQSKYYAWDGQVLMSWKMYWKSGLNGWAMHPWMRGVTGAEELWVNCKHRIWLPAKIWISSPYVN